MNLIGTKAKIKKTGTMKIIEGDLIQLGKAGHFDVIIHGCNCQRVMGSGIALQVRNELPEAWEADQMTRQGDYNKLGNYTVAAHKGLIVVNAYTQFTPGTGVQIDYDAVRSVFKLIAKNFPAKKIGYPKIGAGLAGGDWEIISEIIDEELEGEDHTLVIFKK